MIPNNNEQKRPSEGNDKTDQSEIDKLRNDLKKEQNKALKISRQGKAEIALNIEAGQSQKEKQWAQEIMKASDFPHSHTENQESSESEFDNMFSTIELDSSAYDYSHTLFPKFTQVCEQSRIGQSFPRDITWLALGIGDSALSTIKLAKDGVIDIAKIAYQPMKEYEKTMKFLW